VQLNSGGTLWEQASPGSYYFGPGPLASNVASFAIAGNGTVVQLNSGGTLWEQAAPGSYYFGPGPIASNVTSFSIGSDGQTLFLRETDHRLYRLDSSGQLCWIDSGVATTFFSSTTVYELDTLGNVWLGSHQPGRGTWVEGNVAKIISAGDGGFYVLGTDGNLWKESFILTSVVGTTWVDGQVKDFAPSNACGLIYALGSDGNLWLEGIGWQHSGRTWIDGGVVSFTLANDGSSLGALYVLHSDGNLWKETAWGGSRTWVDGNVAAFLPVGPSSVFVQGTDGNLWLEEIGWQQLGRTWVDGNVAAFSVAGDGSLVVMGMDGNIWNEQIGWQANGRTLLNNIANLGFSFIQASQAETITTTTSPQSPPGTIAGKNPVVGGWTGALANGVKFALIGAGMGLVYAVGAYALGCVAAPVLLNYVIACVLQGALTGGIFGGVLGAVIGLF
jgi:hypothetical protein